jgi:Family of unknown function (DUF5329)
VQAGVAARRMKPLLWMLALVACGVALAAEPDAAAKKEIQHLFAHLEGSGCQFFRNGYWYTAKDARNHLQQKYQYMLDRGMISSTESFIENGAADSSTSRKPYLVRCGQDARPETSAQWFRAELTRYRQARAGK